MQMLFCPPWYVRDGSIVLELCFMHSCVLDSLGVRLRHDIALALLVQLLHVGVLSEHRPRMGLQDQHQRNLSRRQNRNMRRQNRRCVDGAIALHLVKSRASNGGERDEYVQYLTV